MEFAVRPATVAAALGCLAFFDLACSVGGSQSPADSHAEEGATGLSLVALPVYRLVAVPVLLDSPSRLLAIEMRLSAGEGRALSVNAGDIALVLPNGENAQVFDRARAIELLRRTQLADADFSYLNGDGPHPPGGLSEQTRPYLAGQVADSLLGDTAYGSSGVVQGFIVVDTGTPRFTLDGASLEVVAYRIGDAAPARAAYTFAPAPAPTASP